MAAYERTEQQSSSHSKPDSQSAIQSQSAQLAHQVSVTPMSCVGISEIPEHGLAVIQWQLFDKIPQKEIVKLFNQKGYGTATSRQQISFMFWKYGPKWYEELGVVRPWSLYTKKEQAALMANGYGPKDFPFVDPRGPMLAPGPYIISKPDFPAPDADMQMKPPSLLPVQDFGAQKILQNTLQHQQQIISIPSQDHRFPNQGHSITLQNAIDPNLPPRMTQPMILQGPRLATPYNTLAPPRKPGGPSYGDCMQNAMHLKQPVTPAILINALSPKVMHPPTQSLLYAEGKQPNDTKQGVKGVDNGPPAGSSAELEILKAAILDKEQQWKKACEMGDAELPDSLEAELASLEQEAMVLDNDEYMRWRRSTWGMYW